MFKVEDKNPDYDQIMWQVIIDINLRHLISLKYNNDEIVDFKFLAVTFRVWVYA